MPSRRTVLAAGGSLLATGCLGPVGDHDANDGPTTDDTVHRTDKRRKTDDRATDECQSGYRVSVDAFDPVEALPLALDDAERSLVAGAVDGGSTEIVTYAGRPPLRDDAYVTYDSAYYRTDASDAGSESVPARLTNVEWESGQEAPDDASVVAFAALPTVDRRALELAVHGPKYGREREDEENHPTEELTVREYPAPYPDGVEDSRLVDRGAVWVRWNDRTYRVEVGDEASVTRHTYRFDVSEVAGAADAFREHVAEQHLVALRGLSDAERELLRTATDGAYEECEPASTALTRLQERLSDGDRLPHPRDRDWFVEFDGERYELEIASWVR